MSSRWSVRGAGHDVWNVFFDASHVAEVFWIAGLRHETLTMARVADGLNGVHVDVPERAWTSRPATPHRWDLLHNGRLVGEFAWIHPPADEQAGILRVLAGLNWVPAERSMTPPEPAAPRTRVA